MRKTIKTQGGRVLVLPSPEEDPAITAAAQDDLDAVPLTDKEWAVVQPTLRRGRPPAAVTKERITIRLSHDVVEQFRATGAGWQTRIGSALREWLREH